jgi:hypothetical protein
MSQSRVRLREHVREVGKLAEVVGALAKEFERQPRLEVLVALKPRIEALAAEWDKADAILSGRAGPGDREEPLRGQP